MQIAAIVVLSYILGSIPTSQIAGRIRGVDLRAVGSGNLGFTNALRALGAKAAIPVLVIDLAKGMAAVKLLAPAFGCDGPLGPTGTALLAGLSAIAGHIWPVFAGFRGGKGMATACGVFLGLAPVATAFAIAVWISLVFTTRYVSLGSVSAALVLPVAVAAEARIAGTEQPMPLVGMATAVALGMVLTHRKNIGRLIAGTENRFGKKRES